MTTRHIFIVDDNAEFLESVVWMLEEDSTQLYSFQQPEKALDALIAVEPTLPTALLLDVRMPSMSGLDLHDRMIEHDINIPIVYMTGHSDIPLAVEAMKKGAITFLEKPLQSDQLEAALQAAFTETVQKARHTKLGKSEVGEFTRKLTTLTKRESQIIDLIIEGTSNAGMSEKLAISVKTVELHRSRALKKLEVKSVAELVKMVMLCR